MADEIAYRVEDPVATITLDRPDRLNAFTYGMLRELRSCIERASADPAVVGIIVTGAGRGFCAGLDADALRETADRGSSARAASRGPGEQASEVPGLFTYLLDVPKPVIAAVNGVAAGGGLVLAAMCDVRFASAQASFTTIFSKRGLIAEHGTSWILPRLLGPGRALELLWSSRKVAAEEALRIGLVEFVTEPDALLEQASGFVRELAQTASPASMRDTKRLVYRHLGVGYPEALHEADEVQWQSLDRFDSTEGVQSYLERRPPKFPRLDRA
jgi:enoyl-CoA hydratase/carnithine racemase